MEGKTTNSASRIGYINNVYTHQEAINLQKGLESYGIDARSVPIEADNSLDWMGSSNADKIRHSLLTGTMDIGIVYLPWLSTSPDEGLKIGALAPRQSPADCLIFHEDARDPHVPMKLKKGAKVGLASLRRQAILADIRPDLTYYPSGKTLSERLNALQKKEIDAIVCLELEAGAIMEENPSLHSFTFDEREFIPEPGAGVFALQYRADDENTAKLLQRYHDRTTGHCSNVERQIQREIENSGGIVAAYCRVDGTGNFHAWAAYTPGLDQPLQYAQVSASTYKGVPEAILAQFVRPQDGK